MTIRIYDDRIEFDNYSLVVTTKGLSVNVKNAATFAGFTSGSIDYLHSPSLGETSGFLSGGWTTTGGGSGTAVVDKFPFRDYSSAASVGSLQAARGLTAGVSSAINGYVSAGYNSSNVYTADKFPFSNQLFSATTYSFLTNENKYGSTGHSSNTSGYFAGGYIASATAKIEKFPFAGDVQYTSYTPGTLTAAKYYAMGLSSPTNGYIAGGYTTSGTASVEKFPFATDASAAVSGGLLAATGLAAGISSASHGYVSGGGWPGASGLSQTIVQRFSFITDQTSAGLGNLTAARYGAAGSASKTSGYTSGGFNPGGTALSTVDRFPFASGPNNYLVWGHSGLTVARGYFCGHQY